MSSYSIIGLMSGTSMDGLDIAHCTFERNSPVENWTFDLKHTKTVNYPSQILDKLAVATQLSAEELLLLDKQLGRFFANETLAFIEQFHINKPDIDAISSHGHTIFHQPDKGFTYQIGCGDTLAYLTGIPVINDFRQRDVVAGGQGAPLVPIGDKLLFIDKADALLNIGGFTNVCFPGETTTAYDICPGNLPLNALSKQLGRPYDDGGQLARSGEINQELLDQLNGISFYSDSGPKSLGTEWLDEQLTPLLNGDSSVNMLRTCVEHIAEQINASLTGQGANSVFVTGGGAKNDFLMERIRYHFKGSVLIPDEKLIDFKEALVFAFLGALYLSKTPNTIASVTGAQLDIIGGVLHIPGC